MPPKAAEFLLMFVRRQLMAARVNGDGRHQLGAGICCCELLKGSCGTDRTDGDGDSLDRVGPRDGKDDVVDRRVLHDARLCKKGSHCARAAMTSAREVAWELALEVATGKLPRPRAPR